MKKEILFSHWNNSGHIVRHNAFSFRTRETKPETMPRNGIEIQ